MSGEPFTASTLPVRSWWLALCWIVLATGSLCLAFGPGLVGAAAISVAVGGVGLLSPRIALTAIIGLFPLQTLAVRVLERDLGVSGAALVLTSAWKEIALAAVLVSLIVRTRDRWPPTVRDRVRALGPVDLVAAALIVLTATALVLTPTLAALNQARLLLFPVGVYIALRSGVLGSTVIAGTILAAAVAAGAFGLMQATMFGSGWVTHYFGTAEVPLPATFIASMVEGIRASGTLGSPNDLAFQVGVGILVAVAFIGTMRGRASRLAAGSLLVLLPALGLTFSRSAIAGVGIGLLVTIGLILWSNPDRPRVSRLLITAFVPALMITGLVWGFRGGTDLIGSTVATVFGQLTVPGDSPSSPHPSASVPATGWPGASPARPTITPVPDSSTIGHVQSIETAIRLLVERPSGSGLGTIGAHGLPGSDIGGQLIVESWYLSLGLAMGVPGLLLALAIILVLLAVSWGAALRPRPLAAAPALAGAAVFAGLVGLVLPTMLEPQQALLLWALAAAVVTFSGRAAVSTRSTPASAIAAPLA